MAHYSCQNGLASIVNRVLSFEGVEFYIRHVGGLAGLTFRDAIFGLPGVVLVGVVPSGGALQILPGMDRRFSGDEKLVLLAEDASTIPAAVSTESLGCAAVARSAVDSYVHEKMSSMPAEACNALQSETAIVIGWNESIGALLSDLDQILASGSEVKIYASKGIEERQQLLLRSQRRRAHFFESIRVTHMQGNLCSRMMLEELPLEEAKKILILADYTSATSVSDVDGQTMAVVLQVKHILEERLGIHEKMVAPVIVPQILQSETEEACLHLGVADVVCSTQLAARFLALVSEAPDMHDVIRQLLHECHFQIRALSEYSAAAALELDSQGVSFDEVAAAVSAAGEVALGWSVEGGAFVAKSQAQHKSSRISWEMNPQERTRRRPWGPEACVVTLSRREVFAAQNSNDQKMPAMLARRRPRDISDEPMSLQLGGSWRSRPGQLHDEAVLHSAKRQKHTDESQASQYVHSPPRALFGE
eukprot:gnl/TRDRNA2_/TRDRNA2_125935_c0_seq1.p1 gnl/TRDRNA2_/TRDRNA2_125935_c0~~gnl/TRDRNA2_/TRDRNA2_125935_c0_seq1.p1  ORF type:complete len:555 (+),score=85.98 gnl/TRDRNA2_/TRDRNA2_125935_c0_seq1:239-1666(+)